MEHHFQCRAPTCILLFRHLAAPHSSAPEVNWHLKRSTFTGLGWTRTSHLGPQVSHYKWTLRIALKFQKNLWLVDHWSTKWSKSVRTIITIIKDEATQRLTHSEYIWALVSPTVNIPQLSGSPVVFSASQPAHPLSPTPDQSRTGLPRSWSMDVWDTGQPWLFSLAAAPTWSGGKSWTGRLPAAATRTYPAGSPADSTAAALWCVVVVLHGVRSKPTLCFCLLFMKKLVC